MEELLNNPYFTYLILPILFFCTRIADVTLGTMRIVFVSRGNKAMAPLLGFFEVFIWIVAIGQIMSHANHIGCYLAYALGFATGNYVGLRVEEHLAVGMQVVRIITQEYGQQITNELNAKGYGATRVQAQGSQGDVALIYCVASRKQIPDVLKTVRSFNPSTFYSVEDVRTASAGIFPHNEQKRRGWFRFWRKGK